MSCPFGVWKVGWVILPFGICNALSSLGAGYLLSWIPRWIIVTIATFIHVALLVHSNVMACKWFMMTSSNGNIFRVTGPLCGEFTGHRWIPRTKAIDVDLWCFLLMCVWINDWVNNRGAGDLRRNRGHYDVTVMFSLKKPSVGGIQRSHGGFSS